MAQQRGFVRALTWDCAFAAPSARMQYTAGSFAGTLTEWFAWIMRPVKHGHPPQRLFPKEASWHEHTPEPVLEKIVVPAGGGVMRLAMAARHVQHGTVQAYLLYLLIGLAALSALALIGGN
jgi:hydrogenase-4 component B